MLKITSYLTNTLALWSFMFPVAAYQPDSNLTQFNLSSSVNQPPINTLLAYQENYLSLSLDELQKPLYLRIKTKQKTQLLGWIYLNQRTLQKLEGELIEIDLSSVLKPGMNEINISGFFRPVRGLVTVELQGTFSSISHSTGGDGVFQQKIRIYVN